MLSENENLPHSQCEKASEELRCIILAWLIFSSACPAGSTLAISFVSSRDSEDMKTRHFSRARFRETCLPGPFQHQDTYPLYDLCRQNGHPIAFCCRL